MATRADIEDMLARTALGDRAAFSRRYNATSAKLFGICLRVLNNRAEAEDALQDIYVRIWQKAGRYSAGTYSPMTWLITLARNLAIDKLRARRAPGQDIDEMHDLRDAAPGPEAAAVAKSEMGRIADCLDELEPERAQAIKGAYLDGETYRDLAARHDVPVNTMRTWLRRSLIKLKDCLSR